MGTGSFPGVKRPGRGVDHPPLSSPEVKVRLELYLCSPFSACVACSRVTFTFTSVDCVLSAVRTEVLCIIHKVPNHQGRAVPQTVSRRLRTAEAGFDTKSIHVMFVVDTVTLGRVFTNYFCFRLSVSCHPFPTINIIYILDL